MVQRLREGDLPPAEVVSALQHIAECPSCASLAEEAAGADAARLQELLRDEAGEPPRHLSEEELFGWVDGALDAASRGDVQAHLEECALCRDDAEDLRQVRGQLRPRRVWIWPAAAAAALAAILLAAVFLARDRTPPAQQPAPRVVRRPVAPPPVAPPQYANAEWNALVATALDSGRLPFPADLASLRGESDTLRGTPDSPRARVAPSGVVIDVERPEFSWPRVEGATYVVSVYDGTRRVARSEPLTTERWTAPGPLPRGRTYTWQVAAKTEAGTEILPAPPAPPARFRIAGAREHEEITAALRAHPDDHLLLATLYARAGLEDEAREHLRQLAASPDPRMQRLHVNTLGSETAR